MTKFDPLTIGNLRAGYGIYNNRLIALKEKRDRFMELLVEAGDPSVHDCSAEAEEMWKRYRRLRNMIELEQDQTKKLELLDEYACIGNTYDFSAMGTYVFPAVTKPVDRTPF